MFQFRDPRRLVDGDLELLLVEQYPGDPLTNRVPAYKFEMRRVGASQAIGRIELRVGDTKHLVMYGGHIGYGVDPDCRGHGYAARACRLLLPLARSHGMTVLWITCSPDNAASRRTLDRLGAQYVETVDLPEDTEMYQRGKRQACRYRLKIVEGPG
jgi:tagatose 1,6-diphosphate aldolase